MLTACARLVVLLHAAIEVAVTTFLARKEDYSPMSHLTTKTDIPCPQYSHDCTGPKEFEGPMDMRLRYVASSQRLNNAHKSLMCPRASFFAPKSDSSLPQHHKAESASTWQPSRGAHHEAEVLQWRKGQRKCQTHNFGHTCIVRFTLWAAPNGGII